MKKIILLLLVMASFNAFSQETKGVAIDLCVDTSFHDPNYEYLNVTFHNVYNKEVQIQFGFNYQEKSFFYYQPQTCLQSDTMDIRLSQFTFDKGDDNCCCSRNKANSYSYISSVKHKINFIKGSYSSSFIYDKILKKGKSYSMKIRVPKEQFRNAKKVQMCLIVHEVKKRNNNWGTSFSLVNEVTEIQYKCSSLKNIQSKEKVKIELTEDKTKSNSTRVYLDFKITNISNKKIQLLADVGYIINPQVVFSVYDTIVSDTLHFNLYHPKFMDEDVILYNQENDSISSSATISYNKHPIKKGESTIIHLVMPRAEFNTIKCIKMNWFDSFAKGKNEEFEKRVRYFSLGVLENK